MGHTALLILSVTGIIATVFLELLRVLLSDSSVNVTIQDNDTLSAKFSVSDASTTEGGELVFTITWFHGNTSTTGYVNYNTSSGTGEANTDIQDVSGSVYASAMEIQLSKSG